MTNYSDRDFEFNFDFEGFLELEKGNTARRQGTSTGTSGATGSSVSRPPKLIEFVMPNNFPFKGTTMPSVHNNAIKRVAHLLVFSSTIGTPIRDVQVIGHADKAGSDATNINVGLDRAKDVRQRLINEMNRIRPGSSAGVLITPLSEGESKPVDRTGTTAGNALNRRVQIMLPPTCQTMFAQLDLQTFPGDPVLGLAAHPNVDNKPERARIVSSVVGELLKRLAFRAKEALAGRVMKKTPLSAPAGSKLPGDMKALSDLQLGLFKQYLPGTTGFSQQKLTHCFQGFANGEMRSPHSDFPGQGVTEPDSQFFFLFAEFAFLCHDSKVKESSWLRALRAMVGAQEIFMHVYRKTPKATPPPVGAPLPAPGGTATTPLGDFSHKNFRPVGTSTTRGLGQSDAARKKAVRLKYQSMGINQLYDAAAANLLRAQKL
jgi:outer membrane protein OmpA-like peptidoglycan-associated protein